MAERQETSREVLIQQMGKKIATKKFKPWDSLTAEVVEFPSLESFKTQQGTEQPVLSSGPILGRELDQVISIGSLQSRLCCSSRDKTCTHTCPHTDTYESYYHRIPHTHTKMCKIFILFYLVLFMTHSSYSRNHVSDTIKS